MKFSHPTIRQKTTIIGRTGSGKTQLGAWLLSEAPFHKQPYIILDYKRDELLNSIDRAREIGLQDRLPKHAGLYILHLTPGVAEDAVEAWLHKVHERGHTGLYVDEGYSLPGGREGSPAFNTILTQGRSLRIPVFTLTQRPSWISRFIFSEADFFAVFHLNDTRDEKTVEQFTPFKVAERLPPYHSRWYDVAADEFCVLLPVPPANEIAHRIDERLIPKRRFL